MEATQYLAARLNYLSADWPNVQFASKEVCRSMSNPDVKAHERLKRLARYLVGIAEVKWYFRWQNSEVDSLVVSVD